MTLFTNMLYYDVYILMKTQRQTVNLDVFQVAMRATAEIGQSLDALRGKEKIIPTIQADAAMRQRWDRYCQE